VHPLTSLFVGTFSVLECSTSVSVPPRATEFVSNFGSKGPQLFFWPKTGPRSNSFSAEGRIRILPWNAPAAISGRHGPPVAEHDKLFRALRHRQIEDSARGRQFADARDNLFDTVLVGEHLHVVAQVLDPAAVGIGH
jgi:hypothetical protein